MLFPALLVPPSVGRLETWYCDFAFIASDFCACSGASVAPQQAAVRTMKRIWLALLVLNCVVMFVSFVEFS
jgi:hypothetical protein